jgi:multiple sugar transport system permease protein
MIGERLTRWSTALGQGAGGLTAGRIRPYREFVIRALIYIALIDIAFVLLYPLLYILINSFKTLNDFLDPTVLWIPTKVYFGNYTLAFKAMEFWKALKTSILITVPPAVGQLITCSLTGYVFARYEFPGKGFLFGLVILSFIVPPETTAVSNFYFFASLVKQKLGVTVVNTPWPFIAPAFFAAGLRGALFVIIFRQFFKGLPWELEEAARVDGAGPVRLFLQIMVPLALPAMLVVFLFSIVWHWNDYFNPLIFFNAENFPLPLRVTTVGRGLDTVIGAGAAQVQLNEPLMLAAAALVILPPLILYLFTQRFFVEGVERTGLVE